LGNATTATHHCATCLSIVEPPSRTSSPTAYVTAPHFTVAPFSKISILKEAPISTV
jgi:hypothetical protein